MACLIASVAFAQTPDEQTPANEGVCDELQADGITKGLYGLCVAFCEAQDHVSILAPITQEEYDTLANSAPSGRILRNYNKKKEVANNPANPDMPCIRVEEPCPCWTEAELAEIDGVMWDGSLSNSNEISEPGGHRCWDNGPNVFAYEIDRSEFALTVAQANDDAFGGVCTLRRLNNGPNGTSSQIFLTVQSGTLDLEELANCKASIRDFQASSGFCFEIAP